MENILSENRKYGKKIEYIDYNDVRRDPLDVIVSKLEPWAWRRIDEFEMNYSYEIRLYWDSENKWVSLSVLELDIDVVTEKLIEVCRKKDLLVIMRECSENRYEYTLTNEKKMIVMSRNVVNENVRMNAVIYPKGERVYRRYLNNRVGISRRVGLIEWERIDDEVTNEYSIMDLFESEVWMKEMCIIRNVFSYSKEAVETISTISGKFEDEMLSSAVKMIKGKWSDNSWMIYDSELFDLAIVEIFENNTYYLMRIGESEYIVKGEVIEAFKNLWRTLMYCRGWHNEGIKEVRGENVNIIGGFIEKIWRRIWDEVRYSLVSEWGYNEANGRYRIIMGNEGYIYCSEKVWNRWLPDNMREGFEKTRYIINYYKDGWLKTVNVLMYLEELNMMTELDCRDDTITNHEFLPIVVPIGGLSEKVQNILIYGGDVLNSLFHCEKWDIILRVICYYMIGLDNTYLRKALRRFLPICFKMTFVIRDMLYDKKVTRFIDDMRMWIGGKISYDEVLPLIDNIDKFFDVPLAKKMLIELNAI